jgi:hypothetical protein
LQNYWSVSDSAQRESLLKSNSSSNVGFATDIVRPYVADHAPPSPPRILASLSSTDPFNPDKPTITS